MKLVYQATELNEYRKDYPSFAEFFQSSPLDIRLALQRARLCIDGTRYTVQALIYLLQKLIVCRHARTPVGLPSSDVILLPLRE